MRSTMVFDDVMDSETDEVAHVSSIEARRCSSNSSLKLRLRFSLSFKSFTCKELVHNDVLIAVVVAGGKGLSGI